MKLLLILNENPAGSHVDVRNALKMLVQKGELRSYCIYPFSARLEDGLNSQEIEALGA